jgi:tetratricopeptide (TPR) repeat protein
MRVIFVLTTACVFALLLGQRPLAAQSKGSGTTGTSATGIARQPFGVQPTPGPDLARDVILSGRVVIADGSPPPEPVAINTARMGYTDARGFFSLPLVQTVPVMQDVSENGDDTYTHRVLTPPLASNIGNQPSGLGNPLSTLVGCNLRGLLAGFRSTSVMIRVRPSTGFTNVGTIVLLRGDKQGLTVSAPTTNVPKRARKAYEKATAHIKKHKLNKAQAELEHAVKLYPQYAAAWTSLGWLHEQQNLLDQARAAFSQAQLADNHFVAAYVGLASVALREAKWAEAQELSAHAIQLDSTEFPGGFYYNALASFQLGQLDNAEKSALMAERLDTQHSLPQVILLLGSIRAAKKNYAQAAEDLKLYLKVAPTAGNAERVRQRLVELEKLSTSASPSAPMAPSSVAVAAAAELHVADPTNWEGIGRMGANFNLSAVASAQNWVPPDVDQVVPPVSPGVPCPVHDVVSGVSSWTKELMDNLQQFSATEQIKQAEVDKAGNPRQTELATFKYVAAIGEARTGEAAIEEYRDGASSATFLGKLATTGLVAHALMFYPSVIDDLVITCEGLARMQGTPA